jgi:hypothetical protein
MITRTFYACVFLVACIRLAGSVEFSELGTPVRAAGVFKIERAGPTCPPQSHDCTLVIAIRGEITDVTVDQLNLLIDKSRQQAQAENSSFNLLQAELDSPGGGVDSAMTIGRILRREGTGVVVNDGARCLSSCVLVLAGGVSREVEGSVGIHRPYLLVPSGEVSADAVKQTYQRMLQELHVYLREMNIVDGLVDAMLRTNPENMRLLSRDELRYYALEGTDPIWMETFELKKAKSYGLDRFEYMRRKRLAENRCGAPNSLGSECYSVILSRGE